VAIGAGYYEKVDLGPVLSELDRQMSNLSNAIDGGLDQYFELAKIRREAAIGVVFISDHIGGAHFPDESLWLQPNKLLVKAREFRIKPNTYATRAMLIATAIVARNAAMIMSEYLDDTEKGVDRAVKMLKVAEKAGEVAQIVLTIADGAAVIKGATSLVRGYREAAAADKVFVIVIGRGNSVDGAASSFISHFAVEHPSEATELSHISLRPPDPPVFTADTTAAKATRVADHDAAAASSAASKSAGAVDTAAEAVRKEEAVAHADVKIAGDAEKHEIIATKNKYGECRFGECSPPPCPNITLVYKEELKNPRFQRRFDDILKLAATDTERAAHEAAALVEDMERIRDAARRGSNAARLEQMGHGTAPGFAPGIGKGLSSNYEYQKRVYEDLVSRYRGVNEHLDQELSKIRDALSRGEPVTAARLSKEFEKGARRFQGFEPPGSELQDAKRLGEFEGGHIEDVTHTAAPAKPLNVKRLANAPVIRRYEREAAEGAGARYELRGDLAEFAASRRGGYHVYEYLDQDGNLLYVGKSGSIQSEKRIAVLTPGTEEPAVNDWINRLQADHINTSWIKDARYVRVTSELTDQEMWALEDSLIPTSPNNIRDGEYAIKHPQGDSYNAATAEKKPQAVFGIEAHPVYESR
jgi:hypothetical protein